ncbi:MAG: hypothetical protein H0S85_06390 [Desulfovibrionaceae bacterium]|nr:hypothetical protein [Desulfovibrionaceae bacterium]
MGSEEQALAQLRARLLVGTLLLGGLAGLVRGLYGDAGQGPASHALVGLGLALLGGAGGGFLGAMLRALLDAVRGGGAARGGVQEDTMGGTLLGALVGTLAGLVGACVLGRWESADIWAACGGGLGGALGALPGGAANVLLRMLVYDRADAPLPPPDTRRDADDDEEIRPL